MSPDSSREDDCYIRLLLGLLSEEDTERLDELTLVDHEAAARLLAAEHDLIDAYVSGTLTADLQEPFERIYFSTPRRRDKVRLAGSLRQAVLAASAPVSTPTSASTSTSASASVATATATAGPPGTSAQSGPSVSRGAAAWYSKMTARLRGSLGLAAVAGLLLAIATSRS